MWTELGPLEQDDLVALLEFYAEQHARAGVWAQLADEVNDSIG